MKSLRMRISGDLLSLLLGGILLTVLLIGCVVFLTLSPWTTSRAFAAALGQAEGTTCAAAPAREHCDHQDPEVQGCAADAITLAQTEIDDNGVPIGRVDQRYSVRCRSWWGRVTDVRPGSRQPPDIAIDGTTISGAPTYQDQQESILYSWMIFNTSDRLSSPEIKGTLTIDPDNTDLHLRSASAIIPATPRGG